LFTKYELLIDTVASPSINIEPPYFENPLVKFELLILISVFAEMYKYDPVLSLIEALFFYLTSSLKNNICSSTKVEYIANIPSVFSVAEFLINYDDIIYRSTNRSVIILYPDLTLFSMNLHPYIIFPVSGDKEYIMTEWEYA
jgi:hypothetical protein